ncbi:MAG: DNA repair protein RecN [Pseudomonadales bacterium]
MRPPVLKSLTVRDFALVSELDVNFEPGLTVITGASGAGKSILLGALALVLGERGAADVVRPGAARADISAEFDLGAYPVALALMHELALEDTDQPGRCLVRRVISADGRSRAFVNGSPATVQTLKALCEGLVDIHGQHENARLLRRDIQLALLDDYGVDAELRQACREAFREWRASTSAAEELAAAAAAREDRAALLSYQLEELDGLGLAPGEFDVIDAQHRRLAQAKSLRDAAATALHLLSEERSIGRTQRLLEDIDDPHPRLAGARETLRAASELIDDAARDLRAWDDSLDIDPSALAAVEARLEVVMDIARKHRVPPADLPAHAEALRVELSGLATDRSMLNALIARAADAKARYQQHAAMLSQMRRSLALQFGAAVGACMQTLGIEGGALEIAFEAAENESGTDAVDFHVRTNPNYPPGPLGRIASGGERARISLAIQVVAAARSELPCLVLDEADVGVGGTTADVVGRLLRALADNAQVLCVTHAPQVAALGHHHLRVRKDTAQETRIDRLDHDSRIEELARMLAGADITDRTREYARTLFEDAGSLHTDCPPRLP